MDDILDFYNGSPVLRGNEEAKMAFENLMHAIRPESHWSKRAVVSSLVIGFFHY